MAKMGRKPKDGVKRETVVSFKLSEDEVKQIEKLAKKIDIPKTVFARNLLLIGLRDITLTDDIGLLKGFKITSEFINKFVGLKEEK